MISILSTKILSTHQKQCLFDANFSLVENNFIETNYKSFNLENINQNLLFTSQNAVKSLLQNQNWETLKNKSVFCVGLKTKELLTKNGFDVAAFTGYAADLVEIIHLIYPNESFTFFTGNLRRDILPNSFKKNNIKFNEIEVYETELVPKKIMKKQTEFYFLVRQL